MLSAEITPMELKEALDTMANDKSPGTDGLSVEFYKNYWPQISKLLFDSVLESMANEKLSNEQTRGLIKLLPKPLQNLLKIIHWRPITLLNVDYKIISKVFAMRLKKVIRKLIHEDQVGFVEGRYIGSHIRQILDLADWMDESALEGYLISLDIAKAFDTVEWDFLEKALRTFGFPEIFITSIRTLRESSTSTVMNNGYTTGYFKLERGLRQGDPLSPYLFILVIELLAISFRANEEIKGIKTLGREYKLMLFADDATLFLQDCESVRIATETVTMFGLLSGLKLNSAKSTGTGLGKLKEVCGKVETIEIAPNPLKILGIHFCHDKKRMKDKNIVGKFERMKKDTLTSWHSAGLSLTGRIQVLKTLGLSQLTYQLLNLEVDASTLKQIDKYNFNFIWKSNASKIKRDVMIQDYKDGGLKAPCIYTTDKTYKIKTLYRILRDPDAKWSAFVQHKLKKVGGIEYLMECNYDWKKLKTDLTKLGTFYKEALTAWMEIKAVEAGYVNYFQQVSEQIINNNKQIIIGGKSIYWEELRIRQCDKIKHWVDNQGKWRAYNEMVTNFELKKFTVMQYNQMKHALPPQWKFLMKEGPTRYGEIQIKPPQLETHNQIKQFLIYKQIDTPAARKHWDVLIGDKNEEFWVENYIMARKITQEVKLSVFQFKILHRIIATKSWLHKYNITNAVNCIHCATQIEDTLEHFFWECPKVHQFWIESSALFHQREKFQIQLTYENCMFLKYSSEEELKKWMEYCMWVKYFIYLQRLNDQQPNFVAFSNYVQSKMNIYSQVLKSNTQVTKQNHKALQAFSKWKNWFND
jgi:hypothetical protein